MNPSHDPESPSANPFLAGDAENRPLTLIHPLHGTPALPQSWPQPVSQPEWPQPAWAQPVSPQPVSPQPWEYVVRDPYLLAEPREREFTTRKVLWHLFLLAMTGVTTTAIGTLLFTVSFADLTAGLLSGMLFSMTLLSILGAHEMGHYIACRWYGVQATLPYFIPSPIGIGTFGAFIKIKSPIPDKKSLFDIGIAGPLAGFVFALPAAFIALYFAQSLPAEAITEGTISFNDPPLFRLFAWALQLPRDLSLNPVYLAAWVGMLVTSLNLLPVGQLDGGHVVFAIFGERGHRKIALVIWLCVLGLAVHSVIADAWKGWVLYAILLTLMLRVGHPRLVDEYAPLGLERKIVGFIGLMVFLLCFNPFPISFM
ncbi:MAG: site-2 protease family protein [Blastocatellia bacterium]